MRIYQLALFSSQASLAPQGFGKVVDYFEMFEVELLYKWNILQDSVKNRLSW